MNKYTAKELSYDSNIIGNIIIEKSLSNLSAPEKLSRGINILISIDKNIKMIYEDGFIFFNTSKPVLYSYDEIKDLLSLGFYFNEYESQVFSFYI